MSTPTPAIKATADWMSIDERASFEAAVRKSLPYMANFDFQINDDDSYKWAATRRIYEFWKETRSAALATPAIQAVAPILPPAKEYGPNFGIGYSAHCAEVNGWNAYRTAVLAAVPAQQPTDSQSGSIRPSAEPAGPEPMPEPLSLLARPLLYSESVNDHQVMRDDLWIVTTHVVNRAAASELAAVAVPRVGGDTKPSCETCNDNGVIGGFVGGAAPGYDSVDCPDCSAPAAPVAPDLAREILALPDDNAPADFAKGHWYKVGHEAARKAAAHLVKSRAHPVAQAPVEPVSALTDEQRKALEPFAAIADQYGEQEDDDFSIFADYPHGLLKPPTLGQCRAVRALLAASPPRSSR